MHLFLLQFIPLVRLAFTSAGPPNLQFSLADLKKAYAACGVFSSVCLFGLEQPKAGAAGGEIRKEA